MTIHTIDRIDRFCFLQHLAESQGWALDRLLVGAHAGWYELTMDGFIERVPTLSAVSKRLDEQLWAGKAAA